MSSARKSTIFGRFSANAGAMYNTVARHSGIRMERIFFMLIVLSLVGQKSDMGHHVESFVQATMTPSLSEL